MSFGLYLGFSQYGFNGVLSGLQNDPAGVSNNIWSYPDIIPGFYVYGPSTFFGLSMDHLFKNNLKEFRFDKDKPLQQLGSPAAKSPTIYMTFGKNIESTKYYYTYIPSVFVKYAYNGPTSIDLNFMMFVKGRIGAGVGYRVGDAMIGMLQLKANSQLAIGYTYDYSANRLQTINANSHEIVISYTPCDKTYGKDALNLCPAYH